MTAHHPSVGTHVLWKGVEYEIRQRLPGSVLNLAQVSTGAIESITYSRFYDALSSGELTFKGSGSGRRRTQSPIDWSDVPEDDRRTAEYRLEVISPLLAIPHGKRRGSIIRRVEEIRAQAANYDSSRPPFVSQASVYVWLEAYESAGEDPMALLPQGKKRRRNLRVSTQSEAIVKATVADFADRRELVTVDQVYHEALMRIVEENRQREPSEHLSLVSRATVARRLREATAQQQVSIVRKRAQKLADGLYEREQPLMPLDRVEIDHTVTDVFVVDDIDRKPIGRLTFTLCIDTLTRYPLGFYLGLEKPSYLSVMECLYHAILHKGDVREKYGTEHNWLAFGIPRTLVVDNGREFSGKDLRDGMQFAWNQH